jgi:hypothetical protein
MKIRLNMNKIAKGLGAKRRGKVVASGGYFGALQLLADSRDSLPRTDARRPRNRPEG